jgi:uncharacterized RDD family membrane protein YckC
MSTNPYAPPKAEVADLEAAPLQVEYAAFWRRLIASIADTVLVLAINMPLLRFFYGSDYWTLKRAPASPFLSISDPLDFSLTWVLPAVLYIGCWMKWQATPGKMAMSLRIVDARTGLPPTLVQFIGRYLGYYLSAFPLCLGIVWIAFDARKQGWHDKLAGTVVVRDRARTRQFGST